MRLTELQQYDAQSEYSPLNNETVVEKVRARATQTFKSFQKAKSNGFRMFDPKRRIMFSEIEEMRRMYENLVGTALYTRAYTYLLEPAPGVVDSELTGEEDEDIEQPPQYTPVIQAITFYIGRVPANARVRYEIKT